MASLRNSTDNPIRILIVDDSSVIRRTIRHALIEHSDIEVIGTAKDGAAALAFVKHTKPDVMILDIEMPIMDGITTLKEIRKSDVSLPIIMFSSLTKVGSQSTLTALTEGASDYVGKPDSAGDMQEFLHVLEQTLIPKIRALCPNKGHSSKNALSQLSRNEAKERSKPQIAPDPVATQQPVNNSPVRLLNSPIDAVCIGVSTGGPAALVSVFSQWTEPLKVPVFIVQHMPTQFTELLAKKLTSISGMPVKEAVHGEVAIAGQAYLAPGGSHLTVKDIGGRVATHLNQDPPENFCRPAVDVLFRSAARVYGSRLLGVVMTGMGSDGMLGAQNIIQANGHVIAQDEATSLIWGMPGAVVRAGLAEKILPLDQIPAEICIMVSRKRSSAQG